MVLVKVWIYYQLETLNTVCEELPALFGVAAGDERLTMHFPPGSSIFRALSTTGVRCALSGRNCNPVVAQNDLESHRLFPAAMLVFENAI